MTYCTSLIFATQLLGIEQPVAHMFLRQLLFLHILAVFVWGFKQPVTQHTYIVNCVIPAQM